MTYGHKWGFPHGASGKESACQCRRHQRYVFDPWVRKIPWRRTWQVTSVFLPKGSHGQKSLGLFRLQGVFPTEGSDPHLTFPAVAGRFFTTRATWEAKVKFVTVTLSRERTSVGVLGLNLRSREGVLGLLLADVGRGAIQGVGLAVRKLGNSLMVISVGQTKGSNAQNSPSQASAIREP